MTGPKRPGKPVKGTDAKGQPPAGAGVTFKPLWLLPGVFVLTLLAYSNSLAVPFILDNEEIILQDPRVHAVTSVQLHRILTQQYWETATTGLYRPLTTLSYLFNYAILGNGANPEGYHWVNLVLHLLNIALVYALGVAIFEEIPIAVLLCAVWGLHPVQTEAVTNIVGRADLLAAFGVLAGLLCHRRWLAGTGLRSGAWLAAMAGAVAVGVFAKESGVVVLGVIAIHDLTLGRGFSWRSRFASYLAASIPCALYLYARAAVLAAAPYLATAYCDNPLLGASFWTARLTAVKVIANYCGLLLWPAHLTYDYSYNQIPLVDGAASGALVLAFAICVVAAAAAIWSWRRHKTLCFGILFFAVTFSPVSNLVLLIGSIMAERFLYLPSVGAAVCIAYGLWAGWQRIPTGVSAYRFSALAAAGLLMLAYAGRTYDRNGDWSDPSRFWRSGAAVSPDSYKTHLNVATTTAFLTADDWDRAIREAERALAILNPLPDEKNVGRAYRDSAMIFREVGEQLAAKKWAGTAAAGTTPAYWYRKALAALLRSERIELSFDERYRRENAGRAVPGLTAMPSKLYLEMGRTYLRLENPGNALSAFERGLALEAAPEMLEEAAAAYQQAGDLHGAVIALEESYTVDSNRPVLGKLAELYKQVDPNGCSVSRQGEAVAVNPDCPAVHADICMASRNIAETYIRRGQPFEAGAVRKRAIEYLGCAPNLVN